MPGAAVSRSGWPGGLALLVGNVGGVVAGVPLRLLMSEFGWRAVMLAWSLASIVLVSLTRETHCKQMT